MSRWLYEKEALDGAIAPKWNWVSPGTLGTPLHFYNAKTLPLNTAEKPQYGVGIANYGWTPSNIHSKIDSIRGSTSKAGGAKEMWNYMFDWVDSRNWSKKRKDKLTNYLNTGNAKKVPLDDIMMVSDAALRETARGQQHKNSFLNSPLGSLFKTAATVGSAFVPGVGPALAVGVGGSLGAMSGGGLRGGLLGAASGWGAGQLPGTFGTGWSGAGNLAKGVATMPYRIAQGAGSLATNLGATVPGSWTLPAGVTGGNVLSYMSPAGVMYNPSAAAKAISYSHLGTGGGSTGVTTPVGGGGLTWQQGAGLAPVTPLSKTGLSGAVLSGAQNFANTVGNVAGGVGNFLQSPGGQALVAGLGGMLADKRPAPDLPRAGTSSRTQPGQFRPVESGFALTELDRALAAEANKRLGTAFKTEVGAPMSAVQREQARNMAELFERGLLRR
tara:strand:+ start:310 stop:1635 length:1326 start_codon:yes stop_codon:yes gene_type:complete